MPIFRPSAAAAPPPKATPAATASARPCKHFFMGLPPVLPWRPPFVEMAAPSCFLPQGYSAFGGLLQGRGVSCPGLSDTPTVIAGLDPAIHGAACPDPARRSEEHTHEPKSLRRTTTALSWLDKK